MVPNEWHELTPISWKHNVESTKYNHCTKRQAVFLIWFIKVFTIYLQNSRPMSFFNLVNEKMHFSAAFSSCK